MSALPGRLEGSTAAWRSTVFNDNPNDHDLQFTTDTGTVLRFWRVPRE